MFGWFKRKPETETRSSGTGYTAQMMAARSDYIAGTSGLAELTSTVQSCVSLWENGLSVADVEGTDLLTKRALALAGRALALRGEAVFVIEETGLLPCSDWEMTTRFSKPTAYRVGIPDAGGGTTRTVLAAEVLHFRCGADLNMPYLGQSPLRRSGLTAGLLHNVETALSEVYKDAPIGSSVVLFPESPETDMGAIARAFRGYRGKVQVRESVNVTAAGGPSPQTDWKPQSVSPDIQGAMPKEALDAARGGVLMAFGVLPGLAAPATTGPLVREAQRHLAQWALQPLAEGMAEECADKLGTAVKLDVMRPLQAFDTGGRARAVAGVIQALAMAKEAGVDTSQALKLVDWQE
ncbi:hypothetical protein [uncultured Mameliella sp.]|uniref:hypothetical protein n=1 Tax=uncultured Mameliella sp. TaxID=1447087 RepID=UPI0026214CB0|nr:hypothetical protein [uncultured Mameliella sp.]